MSCDEGYCEDCGDCLRCYGNEYCAISDAFHGDQIPDSDEDDEPPQKRTRNPRWKPTPWTKQ